MTKNQEPIVNNAGYGGCGCLFFIICIGVAHTFVWPMFLFSTSIRNEREAREYVAAMNKGQQAYFAEKSVFSTSVNALGLGIKTETANYKYSVITTKEAAFNYVISQKPGLKNYVGGVFVIPAKKNQQNAAQNEIKTISIWCETDNRGIIKPAEPIYQKGKIACGEGTINLMK
jgi:type IV pilus assembly protein PilA